MKKLSLIIFLTSITILMILVNLNKPEIGTIKEIEKSSDLTKITLQNSQKEIIIFDEVQNIEPGNKIKFSGDTEEYKNKTQIIANEVYLIK